MTTYPIPADALDDRLGIVGTAGSGKTYAAMAAVEHLLDHGARVCMIDPLDVFYGLRLRADGKTPAYPIPIFGGKHGDLPLTEYAGALIGETVATMAESCIVSLGGLATKAAERRFMLPFLEALHRHTTREPLHLIFDEADLWAPERLLDKEGEAAKLLGMMETIVRRGRIKGFIPWLITQRPAVVSKNVLSQVDGLIAFKLTSSQDRDALGAWIEGQADRAEGRRILAALPTKQQGEAVIWIPSRGILKDARFPAKRTFDSSRTPKRGEIKRTASLKPLDLATLKGRLAAVEAETKANDPKILRARIAELERAQNRRAGDIAAVPQAVEIARSEGREEGRRAAVESMTSAAMDALTKDRTAIGAAVDEFAARITRLLNAPIHFETPPPDRAAKHRPSPAAPPVANEAPVSIGWNPRGKEPDWKAEARRQTAALDMTSPEQKILASLAQYRQGRTKPQIAVLCGYSVKGGAFGGALASLRRRDWIMGNDNIRITPAGLDALGSYDPLPTGRDLQNYWLEKLDKTARVSLRILIGQYPAGLSRAELAERAGYAAAGGAFGGALAQLRILELIHGTREIRASDNLFN